MSKVPSSGPMPDPIAARVESARRVHDAAVSVDVGTASTGELLYALVNLRDELGALLDAVEGAVDTGAPAAPVGLPPVPALPDTFPAVAAAARNALDQAAAVDFGAASRTGMVRVRARLSAVLDTLVIYADQAGVPARVADQARRTAAEANAVRLGRMSDAELAYWCTLLLGTVRVFLDTATAGGAAVEACGRCRRPFDPADTAYDGHARSPYHPGFCRRCVSLCEDSGIDHFCAICTPARGTRRGPA